MEWFLPMLPNAQDAGTHLTRSHSPGFVGRDFRSGGLLFVGKNPGNDRGDQMSAAEREQFELITRFKDAQGLSREACYEALMEALSQSVMPTWTITRKVLTPILSALGLELEHVAYINLVKFHTRNTEIHKSLFKKSWDATNKQIAELEPSVIVILGRSTWGAFRHLYSGTARHYVVTRAIGDTRLPKIDEVLDIATEESEFLRSHYSIP